MATEYLGNLLRRQPKSSVLSGSEVKAGHPILAAAIQLLLLNGSRLSVHTMWKESDRLIIGKGSGDTARANCFRVTDTAVYATGADYAELFE